MCGIAGLFQPLNIKRKKAQLSSMLEVMKHRGPDGIEKFVSSDERYQAGFTRLAVIDPDTSNQPIIDHSGSIVLMGNGEIYNYQEHRKKYNEYQFRTKGDIESILPLYQEFGSSFVKHLNGMFAIALYEIESHCLTLVRDRLGIKPLYWTKTADGDLVFASEIKALFASGLVERQINKKVGSSYLTHGFIPAPETLFLGVNKLPPGHIMTVDAHGKIEIKCYWRPLPSNNIGSNQSEIVEHLTSLLTDSVKLQLRSDVPIGALLSGGIDSGLLVAIAANQMKKALSTFTVNFEGSTVDEGPLAQLVSDYYATDHTELRVSTNDIILRLPEIVWYCEEPIFDASLLPNFIIEEALSKNVTVVLNGSGGDELFAGYNRYFSMPVESQYMRVPKFLRQSVIKPFARMLSPITLWKLKRAEKFYENPGAYLNEHLTQFPPYYQELIGNIDPIEKPIQSDYFSSFDFPKQSAMLATDLSTYLPDDLLLILDRTTMAFGVEGRVPFLDHRMVEAALAIPQNIRTPDNEQKGLERMLARKFLPKEIIESPKQGFASPIPVWFQNSDLVKYSYQILCRSNALKRGWWSRSGIDLMFLDPVANSFRIFSLLMLELSIIIHIDHSPLTKAPKDSLKFYADHV